jgi:hypothetical protein
MFYPYSVPFGQAYMSTFSPWPLTMWPSPLTNSPQQEQAQTPKPTPGKFEALIDVANQEYANEFEPTGNDAVGLRYSLNGKTKNYHCCETCGYRTIQLNRYQRHNCPRRSQRHAETSDEMVVVD